MSLVDETSELLINNYSLIAIESNLVNCAICLEPIVISDTENIFKTDCEHYFHTRCILEWLRESRSCPICRNKIDYNFKLKKKTPLSTLLARILVIIIVACIFILMLLSWSHIINIG